MILYIYLGLIEVPIIGNGLKAVNDAFLRVNASKSTLILKKNITKDLLKIEEISHK